MTKLSKRLSDDNEKIQLLVGEISRSKNLILMAGGKDNLKREFYHAYRDLPKVQPFVAQNGWCHNLIIFLRAQAKLAMKDEHISDLHELNEKLNTVAASLAVTIDKNLKELES